MRANDELARVDPLVPDEPPVCDGEVAVVIFVPNAATWRRDGTPGGLSLLERQLKQVRKLGCATPLLVVPEGDSAPVLPVACGPTEVVRVVRSVVDVRDALVAVAARLPEQSLVLSGDRFVDLRVMRALLRRPATTFASVDGSAIEPVAWVHADDVRRFGRSVGERAERLFLSTLDPYSPELRGTVEPYVVRGDTPEERRRAWSILLDHVQKRALDLPGQYFDTPFENFLVRRFAPTNVTPNQITLATLMVASVVTALFAQGWLRVGVLLALVVGVLDGVDGKLARLKLATSKLGELEHVGDFFYENSWYVALAWHFHGVTQRSVLWDAGLVLVACDLADSLLYLALQRHSGKMLDELTPFDRRFRAIAGRRNVYVMIFVAGFLFGHAVGAFLCAVAWAGITVAIHAARVAWVLATTSPLRSLARAR